MPLRKKISLYHQQKEIKPLIEDIINEYLDGDIKNTALDFVAYIRENNMKPVWALTNSWKISYKSKGIFYIRICMEKKYNAYGPIGTSWVITPYFSHIHEYEESIVNEGLHNIICDNVFHCVHSGRSDSSGAGCNPNKSCAGGATKTVFGKELKGLCVSRPLIWFYDPDETAIDCIKRLLELEQNAREENKNKEK